MLGAMGGGLALSSTEVVTAAGDDTQRFVSLTEAAKPISTEERLGRMERLRKLMLERRIDAMIVEPGASLEYFTGVLWHRSERTTAAVIPARGETVIVTPAFEEPSVRESLQVPAEVRSWNEHESPFLVIAGALKDRGAGTVAVEGATRFFIVDGVRQALTGGQVVSGDELVRSCRLIKSDAELALMQAANNVTIAALRHVRGQVRTGMTASDIVQMMNAATLALGGQSVEFTLVLLNEASAFPHGSRQPQAVHEGSVILMDCGCKVYGYQSDISRTWVHGQPTARQRKVWETVRHGQEVALKTARIGRPVGLIDDAVRAYYESEGWGPGYRLPGLSHRTGHGIGLDGHEPAYLVHGDSTLLQAGMCFSDEPGLYIPGEFGMRLEDCWQMTEEGPKLFTGLAKSLDDPI
jgi:Xaa-Pro dipeptidase